MEQLAQLARAKASGNFVLAHQIATRMLARELDVSTRRTTFLMYGWALEKMGRFGEALQCFREAELLYGIGSEIACVEQAYAIACQANALQRLGLKEAAAAVLASLLPRARRDLNAVDFSWLSSVTAQIVND